MKVNTFQISMWLMIGGLLSACGSGSNDTTSPVSSQEPVVTDSPAETDTVIVNTEGTPAETDPMGSDPVGSEPVETDANQNSGEDSAETNPASAQNEGDSANTDSQPTQPTPETEVSDPVADRSEQPAANNAGVNFGTAKLLVDLVPNGNSYPAKFHRTGDQLYFWTIDADPRFANCSWHWGYLTNFDTGVAFNLVAAHPQTGAVSMNRQIMTLGDFAEDPNNACAGYNGSAMHIYEQDWTTPQATGQEQQFVVRFSNFGLGPDQAWVTNGTDAGTRLLETSQIEEKTFFSQNKVFFGNTEGLSVSNTLTGDRRKLFEADGNFNPGHIQQIENTAAREATFQIKVAENRYQIWSYHLDTDVWEKKFSIKPDNNTYVHSQTLLADGETLLSYGWNVIDSESALGFSSNYGDVTSFEILTDSSPTIYFPNTPETYPTASVSNHGIVYRTTDFSADPPVTSIWRYREKRIDKVFSIAESGLEQKLVIAGQDGHIYLTGVRQTEGYPEYSFVLELWAFNPQTEQLEKLSDNDWYAEKHNHPSPDEGYIFRYLSTPDGLIFVNLTDDAGRELWFTDGTPGGTRQLTDINPGPASSDPQNFYHSGDAIYFSANDGTHGEEPWMIPLSR